MAHYEVKKNYAIIAEFPCESCGRETRLTQEVTMTVSGPTPAAAKKHLPAELAKIRDNPIPRLKARRCSECGYMQSWLVKDAKLRLAVWPTIILAALLACPSFSWPMNESRTWLYWLGVLVASGLVGFGIYKLRSEPQASQAGGNRRAHHHDAVV